MKTALIVIALVGLFPDVSFGKPAPTAAESLYLEGQAAYGRENFATAIEKWKASYALSGESDLLFNIAQAYRLSGDCKRALETYKKFITIDPAADQLVMAVDFVHELEPRCEVTAKPAVTSKPTKPAASERVPERMPVYQPPLKLEVPPHERPGRSWKIAGLVSGGAGLVMIASGLSIGHRGTAIGNDVTATCQVSCDWETLKDKDARGRRDVAIGQALDAGGIAAIAGGALLYYLGRRQDRQETITIANMPRQHGVVVAWNRSW